MTVSILTTTGPRTAAAKSRRGPLDFEAINRAGLANLTALLRRWLPDGHFVGREYTARNPTRSDRRAGSFRININTGKWADFATGDKGGDVVSLAAYLSSTGQAEAARDLADMLGVRHEGVRESVPLSHAIGSGTVGQAVASPVSPDGEKAAEWDAQDWRAHFYERAGTSQRAWHI